jgi:hypothetical protein
MDSRNFEAGLKKADYERDAHKNKNIFFKRMYFGFYANAASVYIEKRPLG